MRLRRLLIEQYGNFERLDLSLAVEPNRINLVVAPNGAGKSMLRRAFHDLLFGYKTEAKLNYRYKRGLNLQAEAVTASGEPFAFGWRHPSARYFDPDHPDAAARFNTALGGIKPPQLEHLFALDTARLREGGEALASGGDSLGLALLSGTGELMSAKAARATLAARRDEVWAGTRMSSRPLARAAKTLEDARKALRGAVQLPVQREREISALAAETAKLTEARERHAAMQAKAARLARIDRTRRFLEEHRAALAWLAGHPDAPVLAASLADDLAAARQRASLTSAKRSDAQQALATEEDAAAALALDHAALAEAHALDAIRAALERIETASGDIVTVRGEQAGHLDAIAQGLRDLGAPLPVTDAATLLPRRADAAAARQLIAHYASRVAAQEADRRRVRQAQDALDQIEREMLAPPAALEALASLMRVIRADRDPAVHLAETARAHAEAQTAAAAALGAIPGWSGTLAALQASPVATMAMFERLDNDRAAAAAALKQAETECDHLTRERDQWTRQLQEMDERPLPSSGSIADRRALRDQVWMLIYRKSFAGQPVPPAEVNALLGTEPLELALPRLTREADQLVDWRLQELPRAKELERLTKELEQSAAIWERLTARRHTAQGQFDATEAAYGDSCAALGLEGQASLADIRHALSQRAHALAAGQAATTASDRHQAVLDMQTQWATQLRSLLPGFDALPFTALFVAADAQLRAADEASAARIRHDTQRRSAAKVLADAQSDLQASEQALAEWSLQWARCLQALGRPAGETPAATEAVLQCLTDLASATAAATSLGRRIADMHRDITAFTDTVTLLATALSVATDADIFTLARSLVARHEAAQRQRTLADAAKTRLQNLRDTLRVASEREREARQALDAIIAACGTMDGEDADRRIVASRERARQEVLRDAAAAGLAQHGDGLPLAELQADADAVTADEAASARTQTQHALTAARDASEAAFGKVRDLQQTMEHAAEATTLSESVRSQEGAAATFGHLLDDYLVLSLAEHMLVQSVAAVEAKAGSSGVSRIAAAFARVTNDDYTIDGEEGPDGKTVLVALERHWPNERKALAQLSEGTRDQLYLALRIVAIEDHAAAAAPLPFLADDILQTFDDVRALAALQALLALSQHTQVIVLTHHPHVAALAEALPAGSIHRANLY